MDRSIIQTITIGIVALNEEKYIVSLLDDLKAQTYEHEKIEIILVDSGSTDSTLEKMKLFADEENGFANIIIRLNQKKVQAAGWNIVISNASMDSIVRIDAHTKIPRDFIENNIINLNKGECISGGIRPCIMESPNQWKKVLLMVENSLFGSSGNRNLNISKRRYVNTFFHAAYRKEVFKICGLFNEDLKRTEDNEMHYRMRKAGYRFCLDPNIISYQYARSNLRQMIKQKYLNGFWIGVTTYVCPECLSLFYYIPLLFIVSVIAALWIGIILNWLSFVGLMMLYFGIAIVMSLFSVKWNGWNCFVWIMPILFFSLHFSYGLGILFGLLIGTRVLKHEKKLKEKVTDCR